MKHASYSLLYELGFDVEDVPKSTPSDTEEDGVVHLYDDPASKAKSLLRRMTDQAKATEKREDIDNVIDVERQRTERLEHLMMADEENPSQDQSD